METYKEAQAGDERIKIYYDDDIADHGSRDWDNLGKMICFHGKYTLGDKTDLTSDMFEGWDELLEHLRKEENAVVILPLYLYDHGGISMSVGSFIGKAQHAEWDSGQVGFIYATKEDIKAEGLTKKRAEELLRGEVETYNMELTGEIFRFVVEKITECKECGIEHIEEIDSCGGFYGYDLEQNGILDNISKELQTAILKA